MLGGADNPNGELPSYITGADTYSCFIIAGGIFFKQVWNIFLHTVIGSAGEVGKKQPGFIICSSGAGDHPPSQQGG